MSKKRKNAPRPLKAETRFVESEKAVKSENAAPERECSLEIAPPDAARRAT